MISSVFTGRNTFLFILATFLPLACASYDLKRSRVDVGPPGAGIRSAVDDVKDVRREREAVKLDSIHFSCVAFYPNDPIEYTAPCENMSFTVLDMNGEDVIRRFPGHDGKFDFAAKEGSIYHIRSETAKGWSVEQYPQGDLKAGDTVRFVLKR